MANQLQPQSDYQLSLPGILPIVHNLSDASARHAIEGDAVLYIGTSPNVLPHGSRGVVKYTHLHRASVDMGQSGIWRIPYHLLSLLAEAA